MSNNNGRSGLGIASVLAIIFIVLKLLNIITWSWIWVLSPIWISWIVAFILIMIAVILTEVNK